MLKKIICLFFCFTWLISIKAQQKTVVKRLLVHIKTAGGKIEKDNTATLKPCKTKINEFIKSFDPDKITFTHDAIAKLINSCQDFINDSAKSCSGIAKIKNLEDSTDTLLNELKKFTADSSLIKIKFINNSKSEQSDWKVNIDSFNNTINRIVIQDTMGVLTALLFSNSKNPLKVSASQYDSNFKLIPDQNKSLTIQFPAGKKIDLDKKPPAADGFEDQVNTLRKENNVLVIAVCLLFFLILLFAFLYIKTLRKFKSAVRNISGLSNKLKKMQSLEEAKIDKEEIQPVTLLTEVVKPDTLTIEEAAPIADAIILTEDENQLNADDIVQPEPVDIKTATDTYFVCEIMMTAGPRKKPMSDPDGDKDLGEDVCGFISGTKEVFMWLLDGTSDDKPLKNSLNKKEYFSSRLLAQSIGEILRSYFVDNKMGTLNKMIGQAIKDVKSNWLDTIDGLPEDEKRTLRTKIENKIFPQCSTTAMIGHLRQNGDLDAYRTGDSKMFLFSSVSEKEINYIETDLTDKNEKGADRIFFRLQLDKNRDFEIVSNNDHNNLEYDILSIKNIHTIISFSDGIGLTTEKALKEEYKNDPARVKKEIIYQLQGTEDDKTICFIERKGNG